MEIFVRRMSRIFRAQLQMRDQVTLRDQGHSHGVLNQQWALVMRQHSQLTFNPEPIITLPVPSQIIGYRKVFTPRHAILCRSSFPRL